jgi:apolipoprotein N-acyltransferase
VIAALLAAAAAVACYVLAFAPADLGWLAFVALAPWCLLVRRLRGWRLFALATLAGAAILTFGCFWIRRSDPTNLVLMVVPESLAFGVFALLLRALLAARALPAVVALPVAFTAVEFVRGRWPLDGYPWLSLGYSQHSFLTFAQVADLGGVHLVTLLLAAVAGALFDAGERRGWAGRVRALAPGAALFALACGYGMARRARPPQTRPGPALLIVQPNIEQRLKNEGGANGDQIHALHLRLVAAARAAHPGPVDVVAWSETMLMRPAEWLPERPTPAEAAREAVEVGRPLVEAVGAPLLTGCGTYEGDPRRPADCKEFNSAILFDRVGRRAGQYAKRVLVPGGEYLPWIGSFPRALQDAIRHAVEEEAGVVIELSPGTHSGRIDLPCAAAGGGAAAGLTICFEIAYPHLGRREVADGAQLLINLSNEAWFYDSAEFEQYAAMAVFRALETRRALVKVANSGASGVIDPDGTPHLLQRDGRIDGFAASAVVAPPLCAETTLYVRWGEWAGTAAALAVVALLILRRPRAARATQNGT